MFTDLVPYSNASPDNPEILSVESNTHDSEHSLLSTLRIFVIWRVLAFARLHGPYLVSVTSARLLVASMVELCI